MESSHNTDHPDRDRDFPNEDRNNIPPHREEDIRNAQTGHPEQENQYEDYRRQDTDRAETSGDVDRQLDYIRRASTGNPAEHLKHGTAGENTDADTASE